MRRFSKCKAANEELSIDVTVTVKRFYAKAENGGSTLAFYYGYPDGEEGVDWFDALDYRGFPDWENLKPGITSVVFDASVAGADEDQKPYGSAMCMWFRNMTNLQAVTGLANLDTSSVTSMEVLFQNCSSLKSIDLSDLDTSNVKNMSSMFYGCSSLESFNLTSLDLSRVTDMSSLFFGCTSLKSVNLNNIETSSATNMSSMFYQCTSLTSLDVSDLDTQNVVNMNGMFNACSSLTTLNVSSLDTSHVTNMGDMFRANTHLTTLDLSSLNTSNVTDMHNLLLDCQSLSSVNLSGTFTTSKVQDMDGMFRRCYALNSLDLSGFDTSNVTSMGDMFFEDRSLTTLDLSMFNTSNVREMGGMFCECTSLATLDLSGFNTLSVNNAYRMFDECPSLASVKLGAEFNFKGNNIGDSEKWAIFPTPPSESPYNGTWWIAGGAQYTPASLQNLTGSALSGTWSWATGPSGSTFTVSYDANGGTGSVESQTTDQSGFVTIRDGSALSNPAYRFLSWNTKADGSGTSYSPDQAAFFNANTTLYAQWDAFIIIETPPSNWGAARIVSSPGDLAQAISFTEDEATRTSSGEKVYVYVTANDAASTATDDLKKELAAAVGDGYTLGAILDVNLFIRIGKDGDPRLVTETSQPVMVSYDLPNDLLKSNRDYAVSCNHKGAVSSVKSTFDGTKTLTASSGKYSTYGISYKDAADSKASPAPSKTPNTGDLPSSLTALTVVALMAFLMLPIVVLRRTKDR